MERECRPQTNDDAAAVCLGLTAEEITLTPFYDIARIFDFEHQRPKQQWWMDLRPLLRMFAQPDPNYNKQKLEGGK